MQLWFAYGALVAAYVGWQLTMTPFPGTCTLTTLASRFFGDDGWSLFFCMDFEDEVELGIEARRSERAGGICSRSFVGHHISSATYPSRAGSHFEGPVGAAA